MDTRLPITVSSGLGAVAQPRRAAGVAPSPSVRLPGSLRPSVVRSSDFQTPFGLLGLDDGDKIQGIYKPSESKSNYTLLATRKAKTPDTTAPT